MIEVVGPVYKDGQGFSKVQYPPRLIPKRQWDNPQSRADLINLGVMLADDINEPSPEVAKRGPGRPSTVQKQLDALAKELADVKAKNEALLAAQPVQTNATNVSTTNDPAPDAPEQA